MLPVFTAFSIAMLLALITAAHLRADAPLLFVLAALAGTMPSMPAMTRARWTQLFRGKSLLHTAFSLDTVLTEMAFILGPPLAIGLSTGLFAEAGPLAVAVLLAVGVTAFVMQRQTEPQIIKSASTHTGSTWRLAGLPTIVLALLGMGVIGGSVDVAVVAFANAHDWPASASFILAAYALGSLIAGLAFGAFRIAMPMAQQFFIGILVTAITAVLPIFSSGVYVLALLLFVSGVSFAPTMVIVMNLGTLILPPQRVTEGLTWMSTGISIGVAFGGVVAGLVIDAWGARAGFAVPIVAGAVMVLIVLLGLRTLNVAAQAQSQQDFAR